MRNMIQPRVFETDHGFQGESGVRSYDAMMRRFRDKGWLVTGSIIESGISSGIGLEIGPGPGYLGLEWLKHTDDTELYAVDISSGMIKVAQQNAAEYNMKGRARYVLGDAKKAPFADSIFDAAFSNYSLHEWSEPESIFHEVRRVLKKGGRFFISDFRRDIDLPVVSFMYYSTLPEEMRPGLIASINASYTAEEITGIIMQVDFHKFTVNESPMGMEITGES